MNIKQKCGYILYFGKARKKLETRYRKARPARGPIHESPSLPEARKIQARNITNNLFPIYLSNKIESNNATPTTAWCGQKSCIVYDKTLATS